MKPTDKIKVAQVIANMLGVEKAESMSPDQAINAGLRIIKNKHITPELNNVLKKMLKLANEVGIKVDLSLLPKSVNEVAGDDPITGIVSNIEQPSIMNYKEFIRKKTAPHFDKINHIDHTETGSKLHPEEDEEDDQMRRRKVDYKISEEVNLDEDLATADYKLSKSGHKYRAHRVHFKNSKANAKLADDPDDEEDVIKIREEVEIDDQEIEDIVDDIEDEEDILDAYNDDELSIIDDETGEEVEIEDLDESVLLEVLSRAERLKARMRFLRTQSKRSRKLKIALHKRSDSKTLQKRARRLAVALLKKRIMKKPVNQLTMAEKERVEKIISKRKKVIDRIAMRLMVKIRKIENERLSHPKVTKDE